MSTTNRFTVERLDPFHCDRSEILSMARSFRLAYSNDPTWREHYMCPACSAAYPADNPPRVCTECENRAPLVDYWTIPRILINFYREMAFKDSACFVAKDTETGNVIGSCNGLFLSPAELTEELGLTGFLDVGACIADHKHFGARNKYAYQSEILVVQSCQKLGIARELFLARHHHFAKLDPEGISVFRTQRGDDPKKWATTYKWMISGGLNFQVIAEYCKTKHPDKRDRVIAAQAIKSSLDYYASKSK